MRVGEWVASGHSVRGGEKSLLLVSHVGEAEDIFVGPWRDDNLVFGFWGTA